MDGIFGPATDSAVRSYQAGPAQHITPDGRGTGNRHRARQLALSPPLAFDAERLSSLPRGDNSMLRQHRVDELLKIR